MATSPEQHQEGRTVDDYVQSLKALAMLTLMADPSGAKAKTTIQRQLAERIPPDLRQTVLDRLRSDKELIDYFSRKPLDQTTHKL